MNQPQGKENKVKAYAVLHDKKFPIGSGTEKEHWIFFKQKVALEKAKHLNHFHKTNKFSTGRVFIERK